MCLKKLNLTNLNILRFISSHILIDIEFIIQGIDPYDVVLVIETLRTPTVTRKRELANSIPKIPDPPHTYVIMSRL